MMKIYHYYLTSASKRQEHSKHNAFFLAPDTKVWESSEEPLTPWKINVEPTNHPFGKENDLPNLHDYYPC